MLDASFGPVFLVTDLPVVYLVVYNPIHNKTFVSIKKTRTYKKKKTYLRPNDVSNVVGARFPRSYSPGGLFRSSQVLYTINHLQHEIKPEVFTLPHRFLPESAGMTGFRRNYIWQRAQPNLPFQGQLIPAE